MAETSLAGATPDAVAFSELTKSNVPLTTPDVQDVINALIEKGIIEQSD